MPGKS
ncbi:hypothetical protein JD844_016288, partial [Phrynosoma platyrhinos]